ncbi:hypothetical protein GIX45_26860 [Erwinia sp. CPCC 100877]|nr:hypothetical protein [Erwinia sp. CPCC 100877]
MGLFGRLFNKEKIIETTKKSPVETEIDEWQELPGYLPVQPEEHQLVSVIASAIAAGDQPQSQFVIKRILKRNPEAKQVAAVAAAIASWDQTEKQFVIRSIKEKRE